MDWTYKGLSGLRAVKQADADLYPTCPDPAQAAAALNSQGVPSPIKWPDVKHLARVSISGDWARVITRSKQAANLPPQNRIDLAILAAINAVESLEGDTIDPSDSAQWAMFRDGMAALHAVSDLSSATMQAILALATPLPVWVPPLTEDVVKAARDLP